MRVFFAINLPEELKTELILFVKKSKIMGDLVPRENFHVTLKFIGELAEDELKKLIAGMDSLKFNSFECSLKGLGIFGSAHNPSLVFIRIGKGINEIKSLNGLIHKKSPEYLMDFDFYPHITLARNPIMKELSDYVFESKAFIVKEFSLMKSISSDKGVEYKVIKSFRLV